MNACSWSAGGHPRTPVQIGEHYNLIGFTIFAVSAMKYTPAKTITSASVVAALRQDKRIPHEVSDVLNVRLLIVMSENNRLALSLQAFDLLKEVERQSSVAHRSG